MPVARRLKTSNVLTATRYLVGAIGLEPKNEGNQGIAGDYPLDFIETSSPGYPLISLIRPKIRPKVLTRRQMHATFS